MAKTTVPAGHAAMDKNEFINPFRTDDFTNYRNDFQ